MNRTLLTLIRECLHSNTIFHRVLLTYSLLMVVLGGQLPGVYYLLTLVLGSIVFFIWFGNYSRWNHSQEYLSTLPGYNQYVDKAKWLGGILLTLPFYGITLFSAMRQLNGNHGMYETISQFTIKSLFFLALYFIVYRLIAGKPPKTKSTVFLRNIRYVFGALTLISIAILVMAYAKNLSFYDSIQSIENPQRLIPARCENLEDYTCDNPDKLLINLFVTENYSDQQVTYSNHKIIDYPQDGLFELNLGEFPETPARFKRIFLEGKGKEIQITNLNRQAKKERSGSGATTVAHFNPDKISNLRSRVNDSETEFFDPWYRRIFAVNRMSIHQYNRIEAQFIPYNSREDQLVPVPFKHPQKFVPYLLLESRYNYNLISKLTPAKEKTYKFTNQQSPHSQSTTIKKKVTQPPVNLLKGLPLFYLLITIVLILGFFFVQFKPVGLFIHTLMILSLFSAIDYGLMKNRLAVSLAPNQVPVIRITAAMDLNQTIFWRDHTASILADTLVNLPKETPAMVKNHLYITRLMLWNHPNALIDTLQTREWGYYNYQNPEVPDLYAPVSNLDQSPLRMLGKLINTPGIYLPYADAMPLLKFEEHELMTLEIMRQARDHLSGDDYSKSQEIENWTEDKKRAFFINNPDWFAMILKSKIRRRRDIADLKGEDFQMPLTVIPLTVEEQWKLVLGK